MPKVEYQLSLASATLSGGARLASAGGSLPDRITTELDRLIVDPSGDSLQYSGIAFDPDGLHVWITAFTSASRAIKKIRISDGAAVTTIAASGRCMGGYRYSSGGSELFYCGNFDANPMKAVEVNISTGVLVQEVALAGAGTSGGAVFRVPGVNKIWALWGFSGTTWREYDWPAGTATGRTITAVAIYPSASGTIFRASGTVVEELSESTLSVLKSWNKSASTIGGDPDSNNNGLGDRSLYVDTSGRPWVRRGSGEIDRHAASSGSFGSRVYGAGLLRNGLGAQPSAAGSEQRLPWMTISDDGSKIAMPFASTARTAFTTVLVRNIATTQRARWSVVTAANPITVSRVSLSGDLGQRSGAPDVAWTGASEMDWRPGRLYYQIDGNPRVEIYPGESQSISVSTGQTFAIEADLALHDVGDGPAPWIGSRAASGYGGAVLVDDQVSAPAPPAVGTTTFEAIRSTLYTLIESRTPTVMIDRRYRRCPDKFRHIREWANKNSSAFRAFDIRATGDAIDPQILDPAVVHREHECELVMAYPWSPQMYGSDGVDDLEDVMRADARLIRDLLCSPGYLITGWNGCLNVNIAVPERGSEQEPWFQVIRFLINYREAATIV